MIGKSLLPKSLFGRALLILVLPTVLIQLVMAYVFFDRHLSTVTRYMSQALAGEIVFFVAQLKTAPVVARSQLALDFEMATGIDVFFNKKERLPVTEKGEFAEFRHYLAENLSENFSVRRVADGETIEIRVALPDNTLLLLTTVKRLESRTTVIFFLWMMGVTALFLLIAVLFMRNQVRPIRRLAEAADNFGRGVDTPYFRPHGALEVRKAARAFIVMRERITRQIRTRTDMLSGISHDLRTPLTRMKLQLAMLPDMEAARELEGDVKQMEHMIEEYLDFARGEGREEAVRLALHDLVQGVVADYQRLGQPVSLISAQEVTADIRPSSFRRMMHNIIDNALRYGKTCEVTLLKTVNYCEILLDDEGPGIPEDKREDVFKPFNRLDPSRNIKTGGVGLGLTIARDIVSAHGGNISLETSPKGGLRVVIRLPIAIGNP